MTNRLAPEIFSIFLNDLEEERILSTRGIGSSPVYLFIDPQKQYLLHSENVQELLRSPLVGPKHSISHLGLSFALQSGVVPPPYTIYENIFILGIGDSVSIKSNGNELVLVFQHANQFDARRLEAVNNEKASIDSLLSDLYTETVNSLVSDRNNFLFHTAGKDSNLIALALADAGVQKDFTLVSHRSAGDSDESKISEKISKRLGFKHRIIQAEEQYDKIQLEIIEGYFESAVFPLLDNVTLAFPSYCKNYGWLNNSNIVIGDGNDTYMMCPPDTIDYWGILLNKYLPLNFLRNFNKSESAISQIARSPMEWARMSGFNNWDYKMLTGLNGEAFDYWKKESAKRHSLTPIEIKSESYSCYIIYEVFIRKFRHLCDFNNSNLIMPFFSERVAENILSFNSSEIVDAKNSRNKPLFRKVLLERLDLDSDGLGKKGYSFDSSNIIDNNWLWVETTIKNCPLWRSEGIGTLMQRLTSNFGSGRWKSGSSYRLVYRLLLISLWFSHSRYLQR